MTALRLSLASTFSQPLKCGLLVLGWLGLTLVFFQPADHPLDGQLDPSIFGAYAYYTAHGFQFGPEIVAMAGPYGFISYGNFYGGELYWTRFFAELVTQGVFSILVLWYMQSQIRSTWGRVLWIAAHLLLSTLIADLTVGWSMLLAGFFLLRNRSATTGPLINTGLAAMSLGIFALFKGTQMTLSLATLFVVVAARLFNRQPRQAVATALAYVTGLAAGLIAAGQNPLNFGSYLHGVLDLTAGYNSAMAYEEPLPVLARGTGLLTGLTLVLAAAAWRRRRNPLELGAVALLGGYLFVMWKHGFVRADTHVLIFFHFALVATVLCYLQFVNSVAVSSAQWKWASASLVFVMLATGLGGKTDLLSPNLAMAARKLLPLLEARLAHFSHPVAARQRIEGLLEEQRELNALPEIKETVGNGTIDFFGTRQGVILLNGLNYRPRPMGAGSFNVYNRALMERNREFLRDASLRPGFYLLKPDSIDHRLVTQDDALALYEILHRYRPKVLESYLLMEALPGNPEPPVPEFHSRQTFRFGQKVMIPALRDDQLLLARVLISDSISGRIRSTLYKPPPASIEVFAPDGSVVARRKFIPPMAEVPFLLSPFVESVAHVLDLFDLSPGIRPASLVLHTTGPEYFHEHGWIEFYTAPRPAPLDAITLAGLRAKLIFPYANAVPASLTPAFRDHNRLRYLHAPGEIVWQLQGHEREFAFHYGLAPEAYEGGTTNGVEFIVEIRGPTGGVQRIFSRTLRPRSHPADQGEQRSRIPLPPFAAGSRLVLLTAPGDHGDTAWDWSYVTRMSLNGGVFTADQFPHFSPRPDEAEAEFSSQVDLNGESVFMLHVPGSVGFHLRGMERRLIVDFGFLPGAYENGGNTPGADLLIQLVRQDSPPVELHRHALRPVTQPADRGSQSLELTLPPIEAGDILRLRTQPAPGAGNSWGWTYLSRVDLKE